MAQLNMGFQLTPKFTHTNMGQLATSRLALSLVISEHAFANTPQTSAWLCQRAAVYWYGAALAAS